MTFFGAYACWVLAVLEGTGERESCLGSMSDGERGRAEVGLLGLLQEGSGRSSTAVSIGSIALIREVGRLEFLSGACIGAVLAGSTEGSTALLDWSCVSGAPLLVS